ncbi:MAG: GNAT family N-acetyltransferase [Gammaproteobacteria bacterium]|nr:MAG: GNAT family N-acetyltransferase [Gammaproteobacteria bacterium]
MDVKVELNGEIEDAEVVDIYRANEWSSADKPDQLLLALRNSHTLVTARIDGQLIGVGNAISDGHLVVYYPHMLTADGEAIEFYKALGFERAGRTEPMWVYAGTEH